MDLLKGRMSTQGLYEQLPYRINDIQFVILNIYSGTRPQNAAKCLCSVLMPISTP